MNSDDAVLESRYARPALIGRFAFLLLFGWPVCAWGQTEDDEAPSLRRLATGMGFTEGPVWIPALDAVVFSDIPRARSMKWSQAGGLELFRECPNPNGNLLDRDGRLLTCLHGARQLVRTEHDGSQTVLADRFQGRRLNSPNDVAAHADGTLWFTDPPWGLPDQRDGKELDGHFVFRRDPQSGQLAAVIRDLAMPNGIALAPDERTLYVADTGGHPSHPDPAFHSKPQSLSAYHLDAAHTLDPVPKWRIDTRCDGMCIDEEGRIYATGHDAVTIWNPDGTPAGRIAVPETPANVCFGGPEYRTLFITARTSLYAAELDVAGWRWPEVAPADGTTGESDDEATSAAPPWPSPFVDVTDGLGLEHGNSPVAFGDVDGDGWVDIVAAQWWRNEEGQGFTRRSATGQSVLGDVDGDGHLDLFSLTTQRFLLGDGAGGFAELAAPDFEAVPCLGAALGDFVGDSLLDAYAGGYERWEEQITFPDRLFQLARSSAGFEVSVVHEDPRHRARGVTAADFDEDGDLDVYVTNYRLQPNALLRNDGSGALVDVAAELGVVATDGGFGGGHGIGSCFADFDNDGHLDLFAGNFAHRDSRGDQPQSQFLRNRGPDHGFTFENFGTGGIAYQESYASPAAADFDGDGDIDLFFTTVYGTASFGVANHPVLLRNDGDWQFTDVTAQAGLAELPPTYQAAWADTDHDGDLDLVTAGRLFENRTIHDDRAPFRWLAVKLQPDANQPTPFGAQVRVRHGGVVRVAQVESGTGQGNQNDATVHFAFGADPGTVELQVRHAGRCWLDWTPTALDRRIMVTAQGTIVGPIARETSSRSDR